MTTTGYWVGIDGCRGGWLLALLRADGWIEFELLRALEDWQGCAAALAIDMPIGLLPGRRAEPRPPERLVRALLGPRRASVFTPPTRRMLTAREYDPARQPGLSVQAFHLIRRIAELDRWLEQPPACPFGEAHPELAFAQLHGRPLETSKKTPEGRALRRRLLERQRQIPLRRVGPALAEAERRWPRSQVAADDLLDALVLTLVARALAAGTASRFAGEPDRDERGRPMAIHGLPPAPAKTESSAELAIRATLDSIPRGRVATYGQVAAEAGWPRRARLVARVLRDLPDSTALPWWRVIAAGGRIAPREPASMARQARLLRSEGVPVGPGGRIDLQRWLWRP